MSQPTGEVGGLIAIPALIWLVLVEESKTANDFSVSPTMIVVQSLSVTALKFDHYQASAGRFHRSNLCNQEDLHSQYFLSIRILQHLGAPSAPWVETPRCPSDQPESINSTDSIQALSGSNLVGCALLIQRTTL
eukprot:scaffold2909_cov78-Cylindrotheca_fusiformis.AAC.8